MTRVLIVDDAPDYARLFGSIGYEVDHAVTIRRTEALISAGHAWDVAFIDFELEDAHTGLTAFARIAGMPQPPATVAFTVFKRSGGDLYGAACKRWFGARSLIHKQATYEWTTLEWNAVINRILAGDDPTPEPRRTRINKHCNLIDRLLRDKRDLMMWTALLDHGAHQKRTAESLGITTQNVKDWNIYMFGIVNQVEAMLFPVRSREDLRATEIAELTAAEWKGASQARLARFADAHKMFFGAPDLASVVSAIWAQRRRH